MPSDVDDAQEAHYDLIIASSLIREIIALLKDLTVLFLNDEHLGLL